MILTNTSNMRCIPVFFVALVALVSVSQACTCLFSTFKESYDRADSVVVAKVLSRKVLPTPTPPACLESQPPCLVPIRLYNDVRYTLSLQRVFKGCGPTSRIFLGDTTDSSASCGISLRVGATYMLNLGKEIVSFDKKKAFFLNICQGNRLFKLLSDEERATLKKCSTLPENQCIRTKPVDAEYISI